MAIGITAYTTWHEQWDIVMFDSSQTTVVCPMPYAWLALLTLLVNHIHDDLFPSEERDPSLSGSLPHSEARTASLLPMYRDQALAWIRDYCVKDGRFRPKLSYLVTTKA